MLFGPLVPEFMRKDEQFRREAESTLDSLLGGENNYYARTEKPKEGILGAMGLTEYLITDNEDNAVVKISYDADFNVAVDVKDKSYQAKADEIKAKLEEIARRVKYTMNPPIIGIPAMPQNDSTIPEPTEGDNKVADEDKTSENDRMKYKGKDIIFQRDGKECSAPWKAGLKDGRLTYHVNSTGFEAEYSRNRDGNYVVNMKPPKWAAGYAMEQKQVCLDDIA